MSHFYHAPRWLWGAGIGLALTVVAVVCVLWVTQKQAATTPTALEINEPRAVIPAMLPTTEPAVTVVAPPAPLPHIDFQPGSVEEACGLNELPPYWIGDGSRERNTDLTNAFESDECQIALEKHMNALNPYHYIFSGAWGTGKIILMKLVVLDDPLTFAQVFADPVGDSARVQEAFSRPECLLKGEEKNWELNESCHADALLNYALINTLCFNRSGSRVIRVNRAYYPPEDNPTSAQDRLMWKEEFEDAWVRAKCESLDAELQLHSDRFPALYEWVEPVHELESTERKILALLVELAARLGNDTAGLTRGYSPSGFPIRHGYKYGRFHEVFAIELSLLRVEAFVRKYQSRDENTEHLLRVFSFLTLTDAPRPEPGEDIEFDWEWVVRHICVPDPLPLSDVEQIFGTQEPTESRSCKEIVHELRQRDIKFRPVLDTLDKFEQVAIELGVYE